MYARDTALIATPVGIVTIEGDDRVISAIRIGDGGARMPGSAAPVRDAANQLAAWFDGALTAFDLPLAPASTPRGAVLRQAIVDIRYGETATYGAVATRIGSSARDRAGMPPQSLSDRRALPPHPRRRRPLFGRQRPCHQELAAGS